MDPTFVRYYDQELRHVREMGAEFADAYPGIAARLGMRGIECADPYVERLLEGFAFMAARVHMAIDAQHPAFTRHLLDMLYPGFLAPMPSMAVVEMLPDAAQGVPAEGARIPRGSMLRAAPGREGATSCRYRTAHEVHLLPLRLTGTRYLASPAAIAETGVAPPPGIDARAALRLDVEMSPGHDLGRLDVDVLDLFVGGAGESPGYLYEALLAHAGGFSLAIGDTRVHRGRDGLRPRGFAADEAMLPQDARAFSGYRLLQEYFACPQRYLFVSLGGLRNAFAHTTGARFSIFVWLDRADDRLEGTDAPGVRLFCTPAVNLFHREADRIHLHADATEFHVLADRTRPMDFEVHGVDEVRGYGDARDPACVFQPFHGADGATWHVPAGRYYTLRREPRLVCSRDRRDGARSSYLGSEVFLSLVDGVRTPRATDLRQLGVRLLCTNRDLPLHMSLGQGAADFRCEAGVPVSSARCVVGPTWPRAGVDQAHSPWKLLEHLRRDHLAQESLDGLRELLSVYGGDTDKASRRRVEGLHDLRVHPVTRRLPFAGPPMYGRGVEVTLTCDADAFAGTGVYLFGAVMARFFSRYASLNSFAETVLTTLDRTEVARWTDRPGMRPVL